MDILEGTSVAAPDNGSQPGSQPTADPQAGANPDSAAAPEAKTPEQYQAELAALQAKNDRANKQISAMQKKYQATIKGRISSSQPTGEGADDGQPNPTEVFFKAKALAGAELRNILEEGIFPLYDGSDPSIEEPALPASEIAKIRKNPWAFVSDEALAHALNTGDLEPAKLEIEQAMADRAEELAAGAKPKVDPKIPKNINSNPAPAEAPTNDDKAKSPWEMSMQELEQAAKSAASKAA